MADILVAPQEVNAWLGLPDSLIPTRPVEDISAPEQGGTPAPEDILDLAEVTLSSQGGRIVEETYLYQGHALAFLGDGQGAIDAYEQAMRLNKYFYPVQWALDAITDTGGG